MAVSLVSASTVARRYFYEIFSQTSLDAGDRHHCSAMDTPPISKAIVSPTVYLLVAACLWVSAYILRLV